VTAHLRYEFSEAEGCQEYRGLKVCIFEEDMDDYGSVLGLAEHYGWEDSFGSHEEGVWTPSYADGVEEDALDYLESVQVWVLVKDEDGKLIPRNGL